MKANMKTSKTEDGFEGWFGAVPGALVLSCLLVTLPVVLAAPNDSPTQPVEFNRDIRPILSDKCYTCHGPDSAKRLSKLRFDTEEGAKQDLGKGRFAIVPGDSAQSTLIARVTSKSPATRMPLGGEQLSNREIELLRAWVDQGAKWQKHWSLITPTRPPLPVVKNQTWPKNDIDRFVLARLEREGLGPSPEADRATLIRRVTLDLTGLPPSPPEVEAFLADQSPSAYEKVVDRLLASPRYGERMATPWLDGARYADTSGYQSDGERFMWRWRDWVIDAFNRNLPFDQFTVQQIAGDMLPNATLDQKIASGFNRNQRGNSEGGIIPEEYAVEYVVDRVNTTSAVWLGLTVGCARCHDHKYDPIKQKEFYQLFSYFNNIPEKGVASKLGNSPPFIQAPLPEQQAKLQEMQNRVAAVEKHFKDLHPELLKSQQTWEVSLAKSAPIDWSIDQNLLANFPLDGNAEGRYAPAAVKASASEMRQGSGSVTDPKAARAAKVPTPVFRDGEPQFAPGRVGQAASFDGKRFIDAGAIAAFGSGTDKFSLSAWIYPTAANGAIVTRAVEQPEARGFALYLVEGKLQVQMGHRWSADAARVETEKGVDLKRWSHVTLTYDGSREAEGIKVYVDGQEQKVKVLLDALNNAYRATEPLRIGAVGAIPQNRFQGSIADVRLYSVALSADEAAILAEPMPINQIAVLSTEKRSKPQTNKIGLYFLEYQAPAEIQQAWRQVGDTREALNKFEETIPTVMVMEEMKVPRESHLLIRGAYDQPGDKVSPGVPAVLPPLPAGVPNDRLGLAKWLVDPANPLTARVTVNRFWAMYFGTGLVKTVEDFGSQGEWPSHPELLDWLATEFIRAGWDMKAMQKLIVTSATYRQSSRFVPELMQKDPENRLLARGPRVRLPAETVRDEVLAISGLLVDRVGGPSVKPYQPAGVWQDVAGGADYQQDHGDNLYRRSLYTFWKRTAPPPSMMIFDAAGRETCTVSESRTNTPLQALDLMNDVAYLEASRMLAERAMTNAGPQADDRIAFAFRAATARAPSPKEAQVLLDNLKYYRDRYQTDRESAAKLLTQGEHPRNEKLDQSELAAYTMVTSLILNLDEIVTKQ
jgi:hypothetical protein